MVTTCTGDDALNIAKGDAVCVVGWDGTHSRPKVAKASRAKLVTSKTVFGVARAHADNADSVAVNVAGEVAEADVTGLDAGAGAGTSRIIATDITQTDADSDVAAKLQCRLARVDRPDGSEYVVGTCDENGNLVVQPRASRETSNLHVFNVRSYGALGDGAADDSAAITNAVSAIAASGGRLFFPSGIYSVASDHLTIPSHVQVAFEEGAILAPAGAAVTILGPVTCHPAQRVFGGTGVNGKVTQTGPGPAATVSGSPFGNYLVVVTIHTPAVENPPNPPLHPPAALGKATFTYTLNGGFDSFPELVTAASVALPLIGLTIAFGAIPDFENGTTHTWESKAPITLGPAAFDRFSVRNFGAVPDYDPNRDPDPLVGGTDTDNLPFFRAALAAMAASGNRSAKLVADGHFYLSDTLVLTQTVVLEGTAMNEPPPFSFLGSGRSTPGTMLVFPKNVTGIQIRSGDLHDNAPASAEKTVLRNLTIWCKERDATGDGVRSTVTFYAENVTIQDFARDGFHVTGGNLTGNADGTVLRNCRGGGCGRDGFHFEGTAVLGDAQTCVIDGCSADGNGHAGFYDASFGNTYLGCHAQLNPFPPKPGEPPPLTGANYITEYNVNASVFINCWSEGDSSPNQNQFHGQPTIISGKIGGNPDYMTEDSSAFILEHGVATRAPLVYKHLNSKAAKSIGSSLGIMSQTYESPGDDMIAFQWATLKSARDQNIEDFTSLRYLDEPQFHPTDRGFRWWALEHNNSLYRHMIRFPTAPAFSRLPAPWFVNGIYLGRDDIGPPKVSFTAAPNLPTTQDNNEPLTYERGDVVWKSDPSPGGPIGQVCIASGTLSIALGYLTADSVNPGDTTVKLNKVNGLVPGRYITIGDGTDVYTIVKVTPADTTIDITPGALNLIPIPFPPGAVIAFPIPTGAPVNIGDTTVKLKNLDKRTPGQYITIGGGTEIYKIVKVTQGTMDITPGAVDGIARGAAIEIAAAPTLVQTDEHVEKVGTTVTLTRADGLSPGQSITFGGGADVYTIVSVTLPTIEIVNYDPPRVLPGPPGARAAVPIGKAIAFSPATFSTFGEVVNVGNSTSYALDTLLTLADRYVTVAPPAPPPPGAPPLPPTTITLPASPADGQMHSIKSQTGVTTTVDTAVEPGVAPPDDHLKIDGALSAAVAPLQNQTFRYSAATGEWELR